VRPEFFVTETKFLGYIASTDGVRMDPQKVTAIKDWMPLTTQRRTIVPRLLQLLLAVLERLRSSSAPPGEAHWRGCFGIRGGLLVHHSAFKPTRVKTDACDGLLNQQRDDGSWRPVATVAITRPLSTLPPNAS
jgi:hypothetical protein